jgi:hypothetical protein
VVGAPPVLIDSTDAAASSWDVDDCMSVFLVQFRLKVTNVQKRSASRFFYIGFGGVLLV